MPPSSESEGNLVSFVEELKRQWMATIDSLVDPLMIVKADFSIVKANKAMATMGEEEDVKNIVGRKCYEVFAGRKAPCEGCQLKQAADKGQARNFSLEDVRDEKYFEVTSQPIIDAKGQLDGVVQVYRDRTEARKMQEQLVQNEKLASIGLLAGGIAHEINNPLGGILIFSQMLLREMDKKSPHYQDVVEIESATQRCKAIVENLLEFARQQPGSGVSQEEVVDVVEAAKTALRLGKVDPNAKSVDFQENWAIQPLAVSGNRNKLIQVFLNLVQNALQAMPDGGTLNLGSVSKEEDGQGYGIIYIEDSGVGITPKALKRIFDPFFTTKDPGEGTGLGLAICYGIVKDHGGSIDVNSTVNVGTKFQVKIPIIKEQKEKDVS